MTPSPSDARSKNVAAFDRYYDKPAHWFRWRYDTQVKRKQCMDIARRWRRDLRGMRILEWGFGPAETILSFPRDCEITGVEISSSAIDRASRLAAQRGLKNAAFIEVDESGDPPLELNYFDLAIASHVLEHAEDDTALLETIYGRLKQGGALIIMVPINERFPDPWHVRNYTMQSCRQRCEEVGFRTEQSFESEALFYLVERQYRAHADRRWGLLGNVMRLGFNLLTAWWPMGLYRLADRAIMRITGLPPRQANLLLVKPEGVRPHA